MTENNIPSLFEDWNSALQTGDPKQVAALYETDAILLPTISNKVRHNHEELEDYFVNFLTKGPVGKIDESNVRTFGDVAINSGIYTFTFKAGASVQAFSGWERRCRRSHHRRCPLHERNGDKQHTDEPHVLPAVPRSGCRSFPIAVEAQPSQCQLRGRPDRG